VKRGHDQVIGAVLIIAALLTLGSVSRGVVSLRDASLGGAVATAVIGVLPIFTLA
jgi:uncharacterized membrane protein HdeD (DUF308 family)